MRVICGNRELAIAADATGRAPAYYSVVTARPSHPVYIFSDAWSVSYSSHLLDLLSLLGIMDGAQAARDGACCTKESWAACDPMPRCNREIPGGAGFAERPADIENTAALRAVMYELAATGRLDRYPRASVGGLLIGGGGPNGTRGVVGLRREVCEYWLGHGFGPEFWWSD